MGIWAIRLMIIDSRQVGMTEEECYQKLYGGVK